jgi:hypothetical protein
MWEAITQPKLLIYLDVSHENAAKRKNFNWSAADHAEQVSRLRHAREHCDLYVNSDDMTPQEVLEVVLSFLGVGQSPP